MGRGAYFAEFYSLETVAAIRVVTDYLEIV